MRPRTWNEADRWVAWQVGEWRRTHPMEVSLAEGRYVSQFELNGGTFEEVPEDDDCELEDCE